jgi:hypothetical protein
MARVTPTTTAATTLLTCPADTICRIRSISVYNTTATSSNLRIQINRSSTAFAVIPAITAAANVSVVCLNGDDAFYLEPNDILQVSSTVANTLAFTVFYELVT